ncbi:wall-associated receptor kinase-like protein 2, partial [Tanacetum coccineum]
LTTQNDGTFGYLDLKYFRSGRFTAKSDVYAFGVVPKELLTRRKSVASIDSGEGLIIRFQHLMKHNRVFDILDTQVVEEAWMNDVVLQFIVDQIKLQFLNGVLLSPNAEFARERSG